MKLNEISSFRLNNKHKYLKKRKFNELKKHNFRLSLIIGLSLNKNNNKKIANKLLV